jgi:hypothetical protein
MAKNKRLTPEGIVTKSIRNLLKFKGFWHFKHHSSLGSHPGVSDILGICNHEIVCPCCGHEHTVPGRFMAIELKAPPTGKGKKKEGSPDQMEFIRQVEAAGGKGFVTDSPQEVVDALGIKGVRLG